MEQDTAAPTNPLYEAAVGFLVSERSNTNAWEQVAKFVHEYVNKHDNTADKATALKYLKREFLVVERQVKKDFEVSKLPTSWRSAKSTALNALAAGIPLLKQDGTAQPKSDVGKIMKAAKAGTLTRNDLEKFKAHLDGAFNVFGTLSSLDQARAVMLLTTHGLWSTPYAVPAAVPVATAHAAP